MKEYIMGIMAVALLGSIVLSLSPRSGTYGGLRLLCGLCAVCVAAVPIITAMDGKNDLRNEIEQMLDGDGTESGMYAEIYNEAFLNSEASNAEKQLKSQIIQELALDGDDFDVNVVIVSKSDEKYIEKVELLIYASGMDIDPHSVENYIIKILECDFETIYIM